MSMPAFLRIWRVNGFSLGSVTDVFIFDKSTIRRYSARFVTLFLRLLVSGVNLDLDYYENESKSCFEQHLTGALNLDIPNSMKLVLILGTGTFEQAERSMREEQERFVEIIRTLAINAPT